MPSPEKALGKCVMNSWIPPISCYSILFDHYVPPALLPNRSLESSAFFNHVSPLLKDACWFSFLTASDPRLFLYDI